MYRVQLGRGERGAGAAARAGGWERQQRAHQRVLRRSRIAAGRALLCAWARRCRQLPLPTRFLWWHAFLQGHAFLWGRGHGRATPAHGRAAPRPRPRPHPMVSVFFRPTARPANAIARAETAAAAGLRAIFWAGAGVGDQWAGQGRGGAAAG
jgi:hypothetical protein